MLPCSPALSSLIRRGRSGRPPIVAAVAWSGTAEVLTPGGAACDRVPSALVSDAKGTEYAVLLLAGRPEHGPMWHDARLLPCREFETTAGELVAGEFAERIDAALAREPRAFAKPRAEMAQRIISGRYAVA